MAEITSNMSMPGGMKRTSSLMKFNANLFCVVLTAAVLYFGRPVLVPLIFSIFFAMLFTRFSNRLEKAGLKRGLTSTLSILVILIVAAAIVLLMYTQGKNLVEQLPVIEKKIQEYADHIQNFVSTKFKITEEKQQDLIQKHGASMFESSGGAVKKFVSGFASFFTDMLLVLFFTFLLLYRREKYEQFFIKVCRNMEPDEARDMVEKISAVAQNYLVGRAISVMIFIVLFTIGYLVVGLKNALLMAFITSLLTIIPYIGSIVGGIFPCVIALVTEDSTAVALGVIVVNLVVQFIDNHFIEPYVIGGEVNVNAFFSLLVLFVGGLLWGVAGMILFLPMMGVIKIIFDAVPELKPYGFLVGDQQKERPSEMLWKKIKGLFGKKR